MSEDTITSAPVFTVAGDVSEPNVSKSDASGTNTELKKATVLETIDFPDGTSILRLPDKDGKPIYFPSNRISRENPDDPNDIVNYIPGKRSEVLKNIGNSEMVIQGTLSKEQLNRLDYALSELKLPTLLAVHAALNTELDLENFEKPSPATPTPVTLAMLGRPGVGKSFMTALLSHRESYPIINLDSSSGFSSVKYKKYFDDKVPTPNLTVTEAWSLATKIRQEMESSTTKTAKSLRAMLDEAVTTILSSPLRSEIYLVDMSGFAGIYNFGTGRDHGKDRKADIFDIVAHESCDSGVISTHQLTMKPSFEGQDPHMERKLRWIKNDVIDKNKVVWKTMHEEFSNTISRMSASLRN